MIFVTVGSMFPFDRLIKQMDAWAADAREEDVLAQIGSGSFQPQHMQWLRRCERTVFDHTVRQARLVVAHAGVGSIMTARSFGRPIVILPRRQHLGEHNSDHQLETVTWLRKRPGIYVAESEFELSSRIDEALAGPEDAAISHVASHTLVNRLRNFIQE